MMNTAIKNKMFKMLISIFRAVFLFGLCFIILYPLLLKLAISLRSFDDIMDSSIIFLPKNYTLLSLKNAMQYMNYAHASFNSFFISIISSCLHVIACTCTAYSLAKYDFRFKKLIYLAVIITFFVPPQLLMFPTYDMFQNFDLFGILKIFSPRGFNLLDNPISLFMLYGTANALKSGLYIYLLIQFFRNMPKELSEAAMVDGAGNFKIFIGIVLPNAKVMLVTVFLFTFVWQWTDIEYTSMFLKNFDTLSVRLSMLTQNYSMILTDSGAMNPLLVSQIASAGSIIFMLPLVIIYLFCNKFFVLGIERSGIVG